jgi:acyl-CoA synthetase (NDP forming)
MIHFLHQFLNPRSVAILGASNNLLTMGTGQLYTLKSRFKGKIYPIHPREKIILGLQAFQNLEDIPEVPDLLVIVLPTRLVLEYLERAGKFGVPFVIIVSAGFSEVGKQSDQEKISEIAKKYGMRIIGPNCIGIINTHSQNGLLNCTWFPFELPKGQVGNISLASQSGSWISQILIWAERRGIRFGKAISVGNEANVDIIDCMKYFSDDPQTKVVGLYIEGIKRQGRNFITILQDLTKKKPVVVSYAGGTIAGSRAGMSHTASLGGKPEIYDTIFKQSGAIQTQSMEELYEYLHAFSLTYPPKGDRIGLITNSGGPAVSLADSCEKNGLKVVSFSEELIEKLKSIIPAVASPNNPIDLTFDLDFNLFYHEVPHLVWESNEVDALIFYGIFGASALRRTVEFGKNEFVELFPLEAMDFLLTEALEKFVNWVHTEKVPLVISCIDTGDDAIDFLQKNDIAIFKWPSMTVKAMKSLVDYYKEK